ncbi:unnamed protein product, partial [Meganyctiphanes norvegica]
KDKKHMGQKRTYRAVSERYAFVPREAVTKFLVLCTECPRRTSAVQLSLNTVHLNGTTDIKGSHEIKAQVSPKKEVEEYKLTSPLPLRTSQHQTQDVTHQQHQLGLSHSYFSSPPTSQPPLFTHLNSHIPSPTYLPQSLTSSVATSLATSSTNSSSVPNTLTTSSIPSGSLTTDALVSICGTTPTYVTPSNQNQITSLPSSGLPLYAQMPFFSFAPNQNPLTTFAPLPIHPISGSPLLTHLPQSPQLNSVIKHTPFLQPPIITKSALSSLPPSLTQPSILTLASALTHPPPTIQSPVTSTKIQTSNSSSPITLSHVSGEDPEFDSLSPKRMRLLPKRMKREACNPTPPHSPLYKPVEDDDLDYNSLSPKGMKDEACIPTPPDSPVYEPAGEEEKRQVEKKVSELCSEANYSLPFTFIYLKHVKKLQDDNNNKPNFNRNIYQKDTAVVEMDCQTSPCSASPVYSERGTTGTPLDTIINTEDTPSSGNNEDEEDDIDDSEDGKIYVHYNQDRLKAFNIFVRLFVDENLDRIVLINKQPKEKIQAIIDACARQFPEFAERTRKRILSYLKSCRRNKRTRDSNGCDTPPRLTPPHQTSVQAERILASACENEAHNEKRMRLGHEPIAQPNPLASHLQLKQESSDKPLSMIEVEVKAESSPSLHAFVLANPPVSNDNGPTDLSLNAAAATVTRPSLNALEVAAVRQLITGYRESAEYLLQSADKLEHILIQQQAP